MGDPRRDLLLPDRTSRPPRWAQPDHLLRVRQHVPGVAKKMVIAALPSRLCLLWAHDEERARHLNVFLSSILVLSLLLLGGAARLPSICIFERIVGLPCPFCGVLHSVRATLHADFAGAWRFHPAGIFVAAVIVAQAPLRCAALLGAIRLPRRLDLVVAQFIDAAVIVGCLARFALVRWCA